MLAAQSRVAKLEVMKAAVSRKLLGLVLFCAVAWLAGSAAPAPAATQGEFAVRSTQDLVDLCSAPEGDPMHTAALHFCEGFTVGAVQYYQASDTNMRLVCLPQPMPTRDEEVMKFIAWAHANPQYMNDRAVDGLFRFLSATWPCQ
jgi:hypothetical protein